MFAAAVVCLTVIGSSAWLTHNTSSLTNSFTPCKVTSQVNESTENGTKSNVKIQNTGTIDAYIRASVVCSWVDDKGGIVYDTTELPNLNPQHGWFTNGDYYYYSDRVAPQGETSVMLNEISQEPNENGHYLQVTILSEAIQADGVSNDNTAAVVDAWKSITVADGTLRVS